MTPMIQRVIVLWYYPFCGNGPRSLRLLPHVISCLLLHSLVFVQLLVEVLVLTIAVVNLLSELC